MNVLEGVVGVNSVCRRYRRSVIPMGAPLGEVAGTCAPEGGKDTPVDSRIAEACSLHTVGARRDRTDILSPGEVEFGTTRTLRLALASRSLLRRSVTPETQPQELALSQGVNGSS